MAEPTHPPADRCVVLLVEDNDDNRVVYATMLRYMGYEVAEATDGEQAVALAHSVQPRVILMDIAVPLIDGLEATRRIKADPATASIPVIALTARALPADRERCIEAGCDGFLAKPCEPQTVVAAVRRFVSDPPAGPAESAGPPGTAR